MLFDGASLVLYMAGITVYITNIVKGLKVVAAGLYGQVELVEGESIASGGLDPEDYVSREDTLRVFAASNTILALVLVGVLVLQAGQWYAQRKEEAEIAEMDRVAEEKKKAGKKKQWAYCTALLELLGLGRGVCRSGFVFLSVDTSLNPSAFLAISWIAAYVGGENIELRITCYGVPYISLNYLHILSAIYREPLLSQ